MVSSAVTTARTPASFSALLVSMWRMRACGIGAAQNFADQHAGKINVGDVLRVAGDFVEAFDPLNPFADDGKIFCFSHNCQ